MRRSRPDDEFGAIANLNIERDIAAMPSVVKEESYGPGEVFWLDRTEALRRLRGAAQRLIVACPDVEAVYLFGSLAEGRAAPCLGVTPIS